MKFTTRVAAAAAIAIGGAVLLAAPAQAAQTSYEQSRVMAEVVADHGAVSIASEPS